jgi:hypothetical protein
MLDKVLDKMTFNKIRKKTTFWAFSAPMWLILLSLLRVAHHACMLADACMLHLHCPLQDRAAAKVTVSTHQEAFSLCMN